MNGVESAMASREPLPSSPSRRPSPSRGRCGGESGRGGPLLSSRSRGRRLAPQFVVQPTNPAIGNCRQPGFGPSAGRRPLDAVFPQQAANAELQVFATTHQLAAMPHQPPRFANVSRGQPHGRKVVDPRQIGQQLGVSQIGFVGRSLQAIDLTRMSQLDRQAPFDRQSLGQIRRAAAGLDGQSSRRSMPPRRLLDCHHVVGDGPIRKHSPILIDNACLH